MKRFWIRFMIGISFLAAFVGVKCMPVKAATPAGLKEEWRTLRDYPIPYGDERLGQFMYEDVLDINNPPEDMLLDFSTSELAELTLRYPYLNDMLGVAETDMRVYWSAFEGNSFIFRELLWREGGVEAILDVYEAMPFDVRSLNEIGNFTRGFMKVSSFRDEVFIREFVSYYLSRFTENEAERYLDIREQRDKEFYLKIQDESIREYLLKDLDMITSLLVLSLQMF